MQKEFKNTKAGNNSKIIKYFIFTLEILALGLLIYLVLFPLYPNLKYKVNSGRQEIFTELKDPEIVKEITANIAKHLPESEYSVSPNRIIIPKIGVNSPIVESKTSEYGLSKGSWRVPETSTPDKGGNTVITGHRFKYLPPNNLTFYLFHKLETGDIFSVIWNEQNYIYNIKEIKIVPAHELSILNQTKEPIVTLFTCDPIYSTKNRLVVIGELIVE